MDELILLSTLSDYSIEFGIFTSEGLQTIDVDITGENSIETIKMKIADIMYFTEYGTLSLPGTFVLEKSLNYIDNTLDTEFSNLIEQILNGKIKSVLEIDNFFDRLCLKLENMIQGFVKSMIENNNKLDNILNVDNIKNKYIWDFNKLSTYIKCKYFKTN